MPLLLTYALPAVFALGVATVLATRLVFNAHYAERFAHTVPTISKTAAYAPASTLFAVGMLAVAACIMITWVLIHRYHRARIVSLQPPGGVAGVLNLLGSATGIVAGLALAALALISLEDSDPGHIWLSYLFFICQVAAFLLDSACDRRLARSAGEPPTLTRWRGRLTGAVVTTALLFYLLYLAKDLSSLPLPWIAVQTTYVVTENVVALLCFAYAPLYFVPIRAWLGGGAQGARPVTPG